MTPRRIQRRRTKGWLTCGIRVLASLVLLNASDGSFATDIKETLSDDDKVIIRRFVCRDSAY